MEKKKMSLIIGCVALVLVAAIVVLVILLSGGNTLTPSKFGKTLKEGKNYTAVTTAGGATVTVMRDGDKYYYKTQVTGAEEEEWYIKVDKDKTYMYVKVDGKWTEETLTAEEKTEALAAFNYSESTDKIFDNKNYTKENDIYTYTAEDKTTGAGGSATTFTSLTLKVEKNTATLTMTVGTDSTVLELKEINNTKITIPTVTENPAE